MEACTCDQDGAQNKGLDLDAIGRVIDAYRGKEGVLVHVLQDVQHTLGYLPKEGMEMIASAFDLSLAHVYGVASFYSHFYFAPRGRNIIKVCTGTACHVRGAKQILEGLSKELAIEPGQTTEDMEFTLETVSCVGCCALAPVVVVGEEVSKERRPERLITLVKGREDGKV